MEFLLKLIVNLFKSAGPWLNKKWLYVLPLMGFLIAMILILIGVIPTIPEQYDTITIQFYKIGALLGLPVILVVVWLLSTQYYLRSGSGVKIGFAYDWQNVDIKDWKQTKQTLSDLLKSERIKNKVCLKFVPLRTTQVESSGKCFAKRYNFTILADCEYAKTADGKPANSLKIHVETKEIKPYIRQILDKSLAVLACRPPKKDGTLIDVLKNQALGMHDMLLLLVATHNIAIGNYLDANTILRHLDESLKTLCSPMNMPRFSIRELDAITCVEQLNFNMQKKPNLDELERRIEFAEKGMIYFDEFTSIYTAISRAKFLSGDLDGAYEITERFHKTLDNLKSQNRGINPSALLTFYLNLGFLSFVKGFWHRAYNNYSAMLKCPNLKGENWGELVNFIDYVSELELFEGICVLQVFYRKLANQRISSNMLQAANDWINTDSSRRVFNQLFNEVSLISKMIAQNNNKPKKRSNRKKRLNRK